MHWIIYIAWLFVIFVSQMKFYVLMILFEKILGYNDFYVSASELCCACLAVRVIIKITFFNFIFFSIIIVLLHEKINDSPFIANLLLRFNIIECNPTNHIECFIWPMTTAETRDHFRKLMIGEPPSYVSYIFNSCTVYSKGTVTLCVKYYRSWRARDIYKQRYWLVE